MANAQQKGLAPKTPFVNPAQRLVYPKTDWGKMDWSEVGSRAIRNLPSSALTAAKGLNPVTMLTGTSSLLVGIMRKAGLRDDVNSDPAVIAARKGGNAWQQYYAQRGIAKGPGAAEKARQNVLKTAQSRIDQANQADQALNGLFDMYGKRYGSMAGFKEALATDPVSVLMDASTVLGGAGAGARLAKLGKTADVLGKAAEVTNPLSVPLAGTKIGAKLTGQAVGLVRRVPENKIFANGKFTPAAADALKTAFPNLTQADLSNPSLQQAMIKTMSSRGISAAAAKQGLADFHNITVPTSRLTGKAPRRAPSKSSVSGMVSKAQEGIEGSVERNFPHKDDNIGVSLKEAETKARDAVDQQYTAARQIPGEFDPSAAQVIDQHIMDAILKEYPQYKSTNLPAGTFPQGMEIIDDFRTNLPAESGEHGLTMGLLDDKRHGILKRLRGEGAAAGRDRHLLGVIQDGLDNGIQAAIEQGLFKGDSADLLSTWGKARSDYAAYRNNFHGVDKFGNPDLVNQAVAMADKGKFAQAGKTLINGMFDPQTGSVIPDAPRVWEQIHEVDPNLGQAVDNGVRRVVADRVATGKMSVPEANTTMSAFSTDGKAAFTPEHQATVRQVGELKSTLDTTPTGKESDIGDTAKRMATSAGAGSAAGYIASGFTGLPPQIVAPITGAVQALGNEAVNIARGPAVELAGEAPKMRARPYEEALPPKVPLGAEIPAQASIREQQAQEETKRQAEAAQNVGPTTQLVKPGEPIGDVEETMSFEQPVSAQPAGIDDEDLVIGEVGKPQRATGGRIAFSTGGKIKKAGHEELVQRLINKAKQAKKLTDSTTKPLLNVDDAAIVKALSVAQRGV